MHYEVSDPPHLVMKVMYQKRVVKVRTKLSTFRLTTLTPTHFTSPNTSTTQTNSRRNGSSRRPKKTEPTLELTSESILALYIQVRASYQGGQMGKRANQ